jgi:glyoxylase-like metal-dependent hydrolase (beta-lactamase superfamily II)
MLDAGKDGMMREIDAETLREWLDETVPVTVLDIRTDEDRRQWAIPGSIHLNAYHDLRAGNAGPLADASFPPNQPIVTVCNAGATSQTAAAFLSARGLDARSLAGGMKAWSLAWNTAIVPLSPASTRVVQVRRTGKGCLSYVVGSNGEAAVIDPSLPPVVYRDLANQHGWRIRYVLETHVHADHLSRARQLAQLSGATLLLPEQHRVRFPFTPVVDGEVIALGATTIAARRTPGHTDESTSYVLKEGAVFTGDTLFTNGVGRPDLHADAEGARRRARVLFESLAGLLALGPEVIVLPAHASQPIAFDGNPVCARIQDVAGTLSGWLASEDTFVDRLTSRLPPTPPNFVRIVELNEAGAMPDGDPTDLEAGANRCAVS